MQSSERMTRNPLPRIEGTEISIGRPARYDAYLDITPECIVNDLLLLGDNRTAGMQVVSIDLNARGGAFRMYLSKEGDDGDTGGSSGAVDAPGEAQPGHGEVSGAAQ